MTTVSIERATVQAADLLKEIKAACNSRPTAVNAYNLHLWNEIENKLRVALTVEPAPIAAQPERTLLEEHDLNQLPGYHQGRADGRAKGYDVGYRHAIEHLAQPVKPAQTAWEIEAESAAYQAQMARDDDSAKETP